MRVPGDSLRSVLLHMLGRLGSHPGVRDPAALEELVSELRLRDVVMIGERVALPHFRTTAVDQLIVALATVVPRGEAPAESPEAAPDIVVLVISPPDEAALYLQTVSTFVRLLRQDEFVDRVVAAGSPDEVLSAPALSDARVHPRMLVRDVMTPQAASVHPEASVRDAVELMIRERIRSLPVVGEDGQVLGVVSEREVMRSLLPQGPRGGDAPAGESMAAQTKVRDIMSRAVLCIGDDLAIDEAANTMINKDVEQLPVVREGKLAGVVSRGDIISKLFQR